MRAILFLVPLLVLTGCGQIASLPSRPADTPPTTTLVPPPLDPRAKEVVKFSLGLMDTGYTFGGKDPETGLDCSGMVSYVFENAVGLLLPGSAADIARRGRPVEASQRRPGDLVFFNTLNRPRSHVGIYIGNARFIHAPSSKARVRTDSLTTGWFATRFEEVRTYFD